MRTRGLIIILTAAFLSLHQPGAEAEKLRRSPVTCHLSFENRDSLVDDIIEQNRFPVEKRHIDFPDARFGKGIRMNHIPEPITVETANALDLDPVTAIVYNYHVLKRPNRLFEPAIWGSGKVNARLGAVAFWAKGKPPYACRLFQLSSSAFGRKERDLIAVSIEEDGTLSAYLRDSRYVYHRLDTDAEWNPDIWNHVVFNWDWAEGLELWVNGEKLASSRGNDGWFEAALPGLFQLSAPGLTYDEFYLFDRPLRSSEIRKLMSRNVPPRDESPFFARKTFDEAGITERSGSDAGDRLPVLTPGTGLSLREVWPEYVGDGHIPGWYMIDGRNEMAWPHEYSFFTTTPGDADFHAEKADIEIPPDAPVNYVTLTGNLTGVRVQACSPETGGIGDVLAVPEGERFFYGATFPTERGSTFRIPFTVGYGCPPGFESEVVRFPLSGEKRIHNVGLYHVSPAYGEISGESYRIALSDGALDARYLFAVHALTSRDERRVALAARGKTAAKSSTVNIRAFQRINILSEPFGEPTGVSSVTLSVPVKTGGKEETLHVRVHDPAVPSRLWNTFAVRLKGFDGEFRRLTLTIDFHDLVLTGGDRLWIDLGTPGDCRLRLGDRKNPAEMTVSTVPVYMAVDAYAEKEITAARAQYSKMYEFMPWKLTGRKPSLERPDSYGGAFDMILPALAVLRFKPDHFVARYLELVCRPEPGTIPFDGNPIDESLVELKTIRDPYGAPDWAVYMREYLKYANRMIDWWRAHQNPDGQLGGGWNDDTLFIGFHQPYLPLDGNENARAIIDTVHTKIEKIGVFKGGYCRISPMDRLHVGDFVSERYTTVINNLGQAYATEREMESAWHRGHPERTPKNYGDGRAFKSSYNVLNWYWGNDVPKKPYESEPLEEVTKNLGFFASMWTDFTYFRYTEAGVHRDDYRPYGANDVYRYLLAGHKGARTDAHPDMAVMWPSGGGPDVARVILHADDTGLEALCYSFDGEKRDLEMRLCRISDGVYRIGLYDDPEGTGKSGAPVWEVERNLRRFDVVTLPIPPRTPVVIKVEQLERRERPAEMPDLAIDPWDANRDGTTVTVVVHNLGNGAAENVVVRLLHGDEIMGEKTISRLDPPVDFVPKRTSVRFDSVTASRNLRVVVDPENGIEEILEENNEVFVRQ